MECELSRTVAHGYIDKELDAVRALEFERHLESCSQCRTSVETWQSLRESFQQRALYERSSPAFQREVRKELGLDSGEAISNRWHSRRLLKPAMALAAVAFICWLGFEFLRPYSESGRITAELIDAHVRSLQPGHLMDVQSSDQHTVKPWFDGKLAFIPPVADYTAEGFPLVGGRLDVIDGRNVAAIVYSRHKHLINLFAWPRGTRNLPLSRSGARQGYHWIEWQSGDMNLCLVSDAAANELWDLKKLIGP